MVVFRHEIKRGIIALLVWTCAISAMLGLCILIFPQMKTDMRDVSDMFADMGSFSAAFGMDRINFGEFSGFFGVECGNVLGIGGAFFAALIGVASLSKEEKEHTAEFLLAHPISRQNIVFQKLCAVLVQITVLNMVAVVVTAVCTSIIGENADSKTIALMFLAYYFMQLNIAAITFGISAFIKRQSIGIGIGLAAGFYFLNIVANLTEDMKFMKYITPFGYTDGADIIADETIKAPYLATGMLMAVMAIIVGFIKYTKKDIDS